jgi:hypothetical protein
MVAGGRARSPVASPRMCRCPRDQLGHGKVSRDNRALAAVCSTWVGPVVVPLCTHTCMYTGTGAVTQPRKHRCRRLRREALRGLRPPGRGIGKENASGSGHRVGCGKQPGPCCKHAGVQLGGQSAAEAAAREELGGHAPGRTSRAIRSRQRRGHGELGGQAPGRASNGPLGIRCRHVGSNSGGQGAADALSREELGGQSPSRASKALWDWQCTSPA